MLKVLSNILCDLDPKVKVIGQKAGICDGVPSTSALVYLKLLYYLPGILHVFFVVCRFFPILSFLKNSFMKNQMSPGCQTIGIQIRPNMLGLIWVQSICKNYQQTTLVSNEVFLVISFQRRDYLLLNAVILSILLGTTPV